MSDERFRAYVERFLIPAHKTNGIVVLDNLGLHKRKAVRQAIKAAGARLLFLPKYSPDLNPIEQAFAKLKGQVRKAPAHPRRHRQSSRPNLPRRMPKLSQKSRLRFRMNAERSKALLTGLVL
jgi:transposase